MPPKKVKITFAYGAHDYKVVEVFNTTAFKPGEWKSAEFVEKLIAREDIEEIRCIDDSIVSMVMGSAISGVVGKIV